MNTQHYTIADLLLKTTEVLPDKVAVIHLSRSMTYRQLCDEALKMSSLIKQIGIKRGEMIGIYLDKSIEQLIAMFAATMAGAVFVFINSVLKSNQINYIVNDCDIKLLITENRIVGRNSLKIDRPIQNLYLDNGAEVGPKVFNWPKLRGEIVAERPAESAISDDIACLIYTSGSTGMPKGVVVPHRTVVEGAEIVSRYLGIRESDRIISLLPLNFDYGLNQATSAVLHGATLILHQFVMVKDLLDVLVKEKITGFAGIPSIWSKIFNDRFKLNYEHEFPHLKYITNSGGKVPRIIVERLRKFFPNTQLFLMYGLTEAFRSTYLPPAQIDRRPDSMGKAIPNVEILVVNEKGEECAPNQEGELVHRGALITYGYWNDQLKTDKVFRQNPRLKEQSHLRETVVFSGDIVIKDEDGFLYYVSRRDEMIKTSGYRVSPTEIEEILVGLEDISNAVVFSKENQIGEQLIVAVIESNQPDGFENQVMRECRKLLPNYMVPQEVYIEKEFKKTANDKIDRALIKRNWSKI